MPQLIKRAALLLGTLAALTACQHTPPSVAADTALDGRYASEGYAQRAQGYDWVMVTVRGQADNKLAIDINSRSDIKKPDLPLQRAKP